MNVADIAHGRSGDKGGDSVIGLAARRAEDFETLLRSLTEERVRVALAEYPVKAVEIRTYPELGVVTLLVEGALEGETALRLDNLGKNVIGRLLELPVDEGGITDL